MHWILICFTARAPQSPQPSAPAAPQRKSAPSRHLPARHSRQTGHGCRPQSPVPAYPQVDGHIFENGGEASSFANACPQEASPLLLQGQRSNNTDADLHLLLKTAVVLGYGLSLTPRPQQPPRSRRPRRSPRPPPPRRRALPRPRSRRSCPPARRPWHRSHDRC